MTHPQTIDGDEIAESARVVFDTEEVERKMTSPILVTGASGNAGREVIRALREREMPLRAAVHSVERARKSLGKDIDIVPFDFTDRSTWERATQGCAGVFLLRPPAISRVEKTLNPFIDAARRHGAEHVVFLSVAGAGDNKLVPHHGVEVHLQSSLARFTILRPGFFSQNLQDAYRRDIREDDRIYVPAGKGRAAFVDLYDVADVAAEALLDPDAHAMKAYTLTGPKPVSFAEAAQTLSDILGRKIRYDAASIPGYLHHLRRRRGLRWGHALVQTILHVGLRFGQAERVDPTLEGILGRPGRTLETYVLKNIEIWKEDSLVLTSECRTERRESAALSDATKKTQA